VIVTDVEVHTLNPKVQGPTNPARTTRVFSAGLAVLDPRETAHPYMAEALPQLRADTWRVFPDGGMETMWTLRPGLTWHDGAPLTADDFVFAYRVYANPGLAVFGRSPQNFMAQVSAPDQRTVVIRWSSPYPDADRLIFSDFGPLPRHLLEGAFATVEEDVAGRDAFLALPYWTTEYVGNGPYRLTSWEPGSHLEGVAFEGHPLGKPRIDRVVVRFIPDDTVAFTNILAENVSLTMSQVLTFEQARLIDREWEANKRGVLIYMPHSIHSAGIQFRPEYVGFPKLMDIRVRRAVAHGIDRAELNDALFDNRAPIIHSFLLPEQPEYAAVDRAIVKYPFDPRRAEQLMVEAGFQRDREGFFADDRGRFQPTYWVSPAEERLAPIMADIWRRVGIDFQPYVIPGPQARDNQVRSTFPGLISWGAGLPPGSIQTFRSDNAGTAANRWGGQNRGGWSSSEYDRAQEGYSIELDPRERTARLVDMARILSDQVPVYPLFPNLGAITHLAILKGPESSPTNWNIHEWVWTS
jgi:peptide/nickel transport system substrate-binding protein